jgi:hypothetical protein
MQDNKRKKIEDILGGRLTVKQTPTPDFLTSIIEDLCDLENRVLITSQMGIDLFGFEQIYLGIIDSLLQKIYPPEISEIIFWWVFESIDPVSGEILPLVDENDKEHIFKTPKELVKYLKKYYNA